MRGTRNVTSVARKILVIEDDPNFILLIRSGPADSEIPGRIFALWSDLRRGEELRH